MELCAKLKQSLPKRRKEIHTLKIVGIYTHSHRINRPTVGIKDILVISVLQYLFFMYLCVYVCIIFKYLTTFN